MTRIISGGAVSNTEKFGSRLIIVRFHLSEIGYEDIEMHIPSGTRY